MNTLTRCDRSGRFVLLFCAAILWPLSVGAQPVLSVSPPSVSVQPTAGTNAPSQTLQISNAGNRALKWTVQENSGWLSVSPASGVNSGTVTLMFQTSGLAVGQHPPASIHVESNGGSTDISVQLTVLPASPPATLTVTCPANMSVTSSNGSPVVVNYTATTSGGIAPVTVTGTPASGSSFPLGTTTVQVNAKSNDGQTASCSFTVTVTSTSPPPPSVDISVSPTSATTGSAVTVTYSIPNPTSGDWISLSPAGSDVHNYLAWKYAGSCSQTQGTATASGSCPFTAPATAGPYEFRLFANNVFTLLDSVAFTATTSAPATLTVNCPANMSVVSSNALPVLVNYTVTTSGGVAPVTVTGTPASGSSFPVGTTTVQVNAKSSDGQTASCSFTVLVTYTPPPPASGVGPQPTITCPAGAVDIFPGENIKTVVNNNPVGTTFCIRTGVHSINSSIIPKTGNTFVGQYGAILDGTGWTTTDKTEAAFRAYNQDIDDVTIRNLVIRNMSQGAILAFYLMSGHWTIESNEIASNGSGVVFPNDSTLRNNYIHHNFSGGYLGASASNSIVENNEIAFNGWEQKVGESANVIFRNNFVHHNAGDGIWFDNNNTGILIDGNRVEDNGSNGIFYEISTNGTIRNNVVRRSGAAGVFIATSKNTQIHNNTFENNFRGITYFVNCHSVGGGTISFDLANNASFDNTIAVGPESGAFASVFSYTLCEPAQVVPYQNGTKILTFSNNTYDVPLPTTGQYWFWNAFKYWNEWQALGHDTTGTVK